MADPTRLPVAPITQPHVFLVDDEALMLFTMGGILRSAGYAVETFERPEALLGRLTSADHGCVVLDLKMPGLNGLELQRALGDRGITLPLIFVSGRADVPAAVAAMKQGAVDFLSKPVDPTELLAVVARALHQEAVLAAAHSGRVQARARWAELSRREQDVCRYSAKGMITKQIAAELGTGASTVQSQRASAFKRLGISSVAELALLLAQVGED